MATGNLYCRPCERSFPSARARQQHYQDSPRHQEYLEENVCRKCDRYFDSPSNLKHHKMVHLDPSVECYGCYRIFTTYAGMIIHLESGSCDSGINVLDLNESAALCYQWKHYIDEEYRDDMVEGYDLYLDYMGNYNGSVYPFKCPTCGTGFAKLSGLFQHIGSQTCDQRLRDGAIGKLINWLESQHGKRS